MDTQEIAKIFRTAELQRREVRRKSILNHAALSNEPRPPEEEEALREIAKQQDSFDSEVMSRRLSYWRRLWYALINKRF